MNKRYLLCLLWLLSSFSIWAQKTVTFPASDSITVSADLFESYIDTDKFLILCHQEEYSRGEYRDIAPKLMKMNFNCLAIDLRNGKEINYVNNETAMAAKTAGSATKLIDSEKDILGAIDYVRSINPKAEIILLGSSFSASLCLKVAKDRNDVRAVIAYSPGEFFGDLNIQSYIKGLNIPTYMASPRSEYSYASQIVSTVEQGTLTKFRPENAEGEHGAKALWWTSSANDDYWLSLLLFLEKFK